jgi:hypothetical protein
MDFRQIHLQKEFIYAFLFAKILKFQGSAHLIRVGSLNY